MTCKAKERWRANPENRAKERAYDRERYQQPRVQRRARENAFRRKYGITIEEYERMVTEQRGLCAICGRPESRLTKSGLPDSLVVDHDHTSGRVRALLCHRCNVGIGLLREDVNILQEAVNYLERWAK